jgi:cytochrome b558/566 subunit A
VSLAASVTPGGGHTPYVLVKTANDGYNVFLLFKWPDPGGPSFESNDELYDPGNGTLLPLTPDATANVTHLFYNSTYFYQDRVAALWFIPGSQGIQQSPAMELGSAGAITGGAAEIWHWQADPTDNSPYDGDFPGGYTDPLGNTIFPANNLSYAEDDYTNMTGFFVIPGSFGADSPNLAPFANPFTVKVGSFYDDVSGTWTVEMARSFTTTSAAQYRVQLATGSSYYVAFAVWNGRLGESAEMKSVSQWYNLTISDASPLGLEGPSGGGVSPVLAATAGAGLLIVGVAIGVLLRPGEKRVAR